MRLSIMQASGVMGSGGDAPPEPAELVITTFKDEIALGEVFVFKAKVYDQYGAEFPEASIQWTSSDPTVVSVEDSSGTVQGNGLGGVQITATFAGLLASKTVEGVRGDVGSVVVTPATLNIYVNGSAQLSSTVYNQHGVDISAMSTVSWTSQDNSVATVDISGLVTAVGEGSVDIIASAEGVDGRATATIEAAPAARVEINNYKSAMEIGETYQFVAAVYDINNEEIVGADIAWSSSDDDVLTVSEDGLVTSVGEGNADIVATFNGLHSSVGVESNYGLAATVTVTPSSVTMDANEGDQFSAQAFNAFGVEIPGVSFQWTSSDPTNVEVDSQGLIQSFGKTSATISASVDGVTGTAQVDVEGDVADVVEAYDEVLSTNPDIFIPLQLASYRGQQVLYKDSTFTDPVLDVGDPVGGVWDLAQDDEGAVAPSSSDRPIWQGVEDGTRFDGVSDEFVIIVDIEPSSPFSISANQKLYAEHDSISGCFKAGNALVRILAGNTHYTVRQSADSTNSLNITKDGEFQVLTGSWGGGEGGNECFGRLDGVQPSTLESSSTLGQIDEMTYGSESSRHAYVQSRWFVFRYREPSESEMLTLEATNLPPQNEVVSITLDHTSITLDANETQKIVAKAFDENDEPVYVAQYTWSSSDENVAVVDSSGLIEAYGPGTATISASVDGVTGTAQVVVEGEIAHKVGVYDIILDKGPILSFQADLDTYRGTQYLFKDTAATDFAGELGDPLGAVVPLVGEGVFSQEEQHRRPTRGDGAVFQGNQQLIHSLKGVSDFVLKQGDFCVVYVLSGAVDSGSTYMALSGTKDSSAAHFGWTAQLVQSENDNRVRFYYRSLDSNKSLSWSFGGSPLKWGGVLVYNSGVVDSTSSAVSLRVNGVSEGEKSLTLETDESVESPFHMMVGSTTNGSLVGSIASFHIFDRPLSVSELEDIESAILSPQDEVASITLDHTSITLDANETQKIVAKAFDESNNPVYGAQYVWTSSDENVAAVDYSGLIEAYGPGTATITATIGDATASLTITVEGEVADVVEAYDQILLLNPDVDVMFRLPRYRGQQILFQDSSCTVPVTAPGDPVGGVLSIATQERTAFAQTSTDRFVWLGEDQGARMNKVRLTIDKAPEYWDFLEDGVWTIASGTKAISEAEGSGWRTLYGRGATASARSRNLQFNYSHTTRRYYTSGYGVSGALTVDIEVGFDQYKGLVYTSDGAYTNFFQDKLADDSPPVAIHPNWEDPGPSDYPFYIGGNAFASYNFKGVSSGFIFLKEHADASLANELTDLLTVGLKND